MVRTLLALMLVPLFGCELIIDVNSSQSFQCCGIQEPTCDCFQTGGLSDEDGNCETICDAPPDGWILDETGECAQLVFAGSGNSCLIGDAGPIPDASPPDAALDAGTSDAGPDASPDAS